MSPSSETCTTPNRILSKFSAKASSGMCTTPNNMLLEYDAKNRVTPVHPSLKGISTSLIEKVYVMHACMGITLLNLTN